MSAKHARMAGLSCLLMTVLAMNFSYAGPDGAAYQAKMKEASRAQARGLWMDAAQAFDAAAGLAADDAQRALAQLGQGRNLVAAGDAGAGRATLRKALESQALKPDDCAEAWKLIGNSHRGEYSFDLAVEAYTRIISLSNVNVAGQARGFAAIGETEYARGNYPGAREAWARALALPRVAPIHLQPAWIGMGDSYMAEGNFQEAFQAYQQVLKAGNADAPTKQRAGIGAGNALYEAGDYPGACKAYLALADKHQAPLTVIERLDTIFRMQLHKAAALRAAGKLAAARAEYAMVLDMERVEDHHRATARLGIGQCLEAEKQFAEARAAYAAVMAMPGVRWPDRGRAQMGLARCFEAEGNRQAAREAYAKLLDMSNIAESDRAAAQARLQNEG